MMEKNGKTFADVMEAADANSKLKYETEVKVYVEETLPAAISAFEAPDRHDIGSGISVESGIKNAFSDHPFDVADALRFEAIDRFANAPQANYVDDIKTMVEIGTHSQVSDMLEFFDIGGKYQVFPKESVEKAFSEELDGLKAGVAEVVKGFDDGKPVEDLKAGLTLASECADSCAALFPALKDPDAGMADVLKKANGIIADVGTELKAIEAKAIEIGGDVKEEYYRVAEDIDFREEAGVLGAGAEGAVEKENESGSESYQD
jgi:hypothetical protein